MMDFFDESATSWIVVV